MDSTELHFGFIFVCLVATCSEDVGNTCFFSFWKPVEYFAMMLKTCGKVILVLVLRESPNAILVICILNHPPCEIPA